MLAPCLHPPTHVHINILTVGGYSDGHTDIPTPIIIPIILTVSGTYLQTDRHHTSYIDIRVTLHFAILIHIYPFLIQHFSGTMMNSLRGNFLEEAKGVKIRSLPVLEDFLV